MSHNHLIHETSPYLLQHAHNPVDWYPWGEAALEKARQENKLLIVSIGYAACHWCHVMERESFEDAEVARFMNEHFVAIKVDREERPDIDQVYMEAVQMLTGSGGWPLNCIALPDGRPVYGGTYFPRLQWLNVLAQVVNFVRQYPEKAEQQARALTQGVQGSGLFEIPRGTPEYSGQDLEAIFKFWQSDLDDVWGGHKRAPKFPLPVGWQFLLHYHYLTGNTKALQAVLLTLDKMADGGIYDQVGGGFARYATDSTWKAPHFEKMLYDNAQLVSLYASAFQLTRQPRYQTIVQETLDFVERELTSPEGGFYSSLDADSEGEEGKYYVWRMPEWQDVLGDKAALLAEVFNVTDSGNWERGANILWKTSADYEIAARHGVTVEALAEQVAAAKKALLTVRQQRVSPALDDKILTAWNALMLKAYIDAYRVLDDDAYLAAGLKSAEFIKAKMMSIDYRLARNYKNGTATINAFLDDYAFTIEAFTALYQATFDEKWLHEANQLTTYVIKHFYDEPSGMFYYSSDIDPPLIARKMEIADNVIPASNSVMAKNLFVLGHYFYNDDYIEKARRLLGNVKSAALRGAAYYANWDILLAWLVDPPYEVAIVGKDYAARRREFDCHYLPNVFLAGGAEEGTLRLLKGKQVEGQTTTYVCRDKTCQVPVTEIRAALAQIKSNMDHIANAE
ncbi:MAG: thioredoxin domain-containing protein [Anaerolineales bacterium]|nr:thioredoxin domain-containing protein [Anaerolineales bacterium]